MGGTDECGFSTNRKVENVVLSIYPADLVQHCFNSTPKTLSMSGLRTRSFQQKKEDLFFFLCLAYLRNQIYLAVLVRAHHSKLISCCPNMVIGPREALKDRLPTHFSLTSSKISTTFQWPYHKLQNCRFH